MSAKTFNFTGHSTVCSQSYLGWKNYANSALTLLRARNSSLTDVFTAQRVSNPENVSMLWSIHEKKTAQRCWQREQNLEMVFKRFSISSSLNFAFLTLQTCLPQATRFYFVGYDIKAYISVIQVKEVTNLTCAWLFPVRSLCSSFNHHNVLCSPYIPTLKTAKKIPPHHKTQVLAYLLVITCCTWQYKTCRENHVAHGPSARKQVQPTKVTINQIHIKSVILLLITHSLMQREQKWLGETRVHARDCKTMFWQREGDNDDDESAV